MKYFNCDYNEGAYPPILKRMNETNMCQSIGYSEDEYCEEARNIIRGLCGAPDAAVHFLVGGTQANLTVISAALRSHQGVISASTGHINVHETGAIEATGHKVLSVNTDDGLLTAEMVEKVCHDHFVDEAFEHMVQPGMVYISSPSELGTIYSRKALSDLRAVCDKYGLLLYLDGARFANLPDHLVNVRVGKEMYQRRGGKKYFLSEAKLQKYMYDNKVIGFIDFIVNVGKRFIVQIVLPNKLRSWVFKKFARKTV